MLTELKTTIIGFLAQVILISRVNCDIFYFNFDEQMFLDGIDV